MYENLVHFFENEPKSLCQPPLSCCLTLFIFFSDRYVIILMLTWTLKRCYNAYERHLNSEKRTSTSIWSAFLKMNKIACPPSSKIGV